MVDLRADAPTGRAAVSYVGGDILALCGSLGHVELRTVGLGGFGRGPLCGVVDFVALVNENGFDFLPSFHSRGLGNK